MITFLELRIQKKSEKRPQKWARNSDPFLVPLSVGILVLANHFRAHFWNRTIWTRSDHFFSNMQPENSKV